MENLANYPPDLIERLLSTFDLAITSSMLLLPCTNAHQEPKIYTTKLIKIASTLQHYGIMRKKIDFKKRQEPGALDRN